jgi:hypothetical protein
LLQAANPETFEYNIVKTNTNIWLANIRGKESSGCMDVDVKIKMDSAEMGREGVNRIGLLQYTSRGLLGCDAV